MKQTIIETKTRTGVIFCDTERKMEYLYVGDYGKENNIKANFLNLNKEINGVVHKEVDLSEKMVVTISTQKGCPMNCMFCDCPHFGYFGNLSAEDMTAEVIRAVVESRCTYTKRFNLHLARMGEPSLNYDNISTLLTILPELIRTAGLNADVIHPVFTTMLPKTIDKKQLTHLLINFCQYHKNALYKGEASLQLSINSTDEEQRNKLFRGKSHSLTDISDIARQLPMPKGRKYTLNFPVTKDTILDPKRLSELFDKDKFIVKITPIHETNEAKANGIETNEGYYSYDVYKQFEQPLLDEGWDVIVFVPSKEEDEDRITCGNALISAMKNNPYKQKTFMEKNNTARLSSLFKPSDSNKKSEFRPFKDWQEMFNCLMVMGVSRYPMCVARTKQNGKELDDNPIYAIVSAFDRNGLCFKMHRLEYKEVTHRQRRGKEGTHRRLSCTNDFIEVTAQELFDDFYIDGGFVCGIPKKMVW